jgi:hypothetical protein
MRYHFAPLGPAVFTILGAVAQLGHFMIIDKDFEPT